MGPLLARCADCLPGGAWLAGELPEVTETATASLTPEECDRMDAYGAMIDGTGGVDEVTRSELAAVACVVQDAPWLTAEQQIRLVAVASLVAGAARLLAQDPGTAIEHGQLERMWALLDHAIV
ncbi:hypothetical protein SAMN05216483_6468 [Streptomyces sp. 2131.1]|uniref:hypothetical protein n=1 Tax=Streptomyces sp. 2131.1 TaxID=1855346 RepID=UPI00089A9FC6|nr:hypothetical protein [Streptomyces sp. 2131.1]SEE51353.1 hypothetical protein SAMN05216483_6468 [Streptomyces sp. 2131.1]